MVESQTEYKPFTPPEDADLINRRFRDTEALDFGADLARRTDALFEKFHLHLWDRPRIAVFNWRRNVRRRKEFRAAEPLVSTNRELQNLYRQLEQIKEGEKSYKQDPRSLDGITSRSQISQAERKDDIIDRIRVLEKAKGPSQYRLDRDRRTVAGYENKIKNITYSVNLRIGYHSQILQNRIDLLQADKNRLIHLLEDRASTIKRQKEQLNSLVTELAAEEYDQEENIRENYQFEDNRRIVNELKERIRDGDYAIRNLHGQLRQIDRSLDRIAKNKNYWTSFSNKFTPDSYLDSDDLDVDPFEHLSPDYARAGGKITETRERSYKIDVHNNPIINRLYESFAYFFDSSFNDIRDIVVELTKGLGLEERGANLRDLLNSFSKDVLPGIVGDHSVNLKESDFRRYFSQYLSAAFPPDYNI